MTMSSLRFVFAFLALFAIISTVSAGVYEAAKNRGFNERIVKKRTGDESLPKFMKRAPAESATTSSVCTTTTAPIATNPPTTCGGNNCANAFNKQFTASLSDLEGFCSSWTASTSASFEPTGTASWAANCVGPSTAATLQASVASTVSSACSCFVPEPTPCPSAVTRFLTAKTEPFKVDSLPEVDFDIGEMYSGLIPIDTKDPSRELFFVFQPTVGAPVDEVTIWLNGGPGCSSLEGFFQENGLFVWAWNMYEPQVNPYSWVNLTNVLWVEQPVGTGFSVGDVTATSEEDVAQDFANWFVNFQTTFGISKFKIYVTGESYAGRYVPYISAAFIDRNDTEYFDLKGALVYDPTIGSSDYIQEQLVAYPYVEENNNIIGLNKSFMATLKESDVSCGFEAYRNKYLVYPASGVQPPAPDYPDNCAINDLASNAGFNVNPCFNSYEINTQCPMPSDPLGFPTNLVYSYQGLLPLYFDRADVKAAMHAPTSIDWQECSGPVFVDGIDNSLDPIQYVLPKVIEYTNRTLVANADLDMVIITAGTLLAIQNMTWNGKLGFQSEPATDIVITLPDLQYGQTFVDNGYPAGFEDPQGTMGVQHFERGLMWAETFLSGHMQPQFQPRSSYRHLQWLLGHIEEL